MARVRRSRYVCFFCDDFPFLDVGLLLRDALATGVAQRSDKRRPRVELAKRIERAHQVGGVYNVQTEPAQATLERSPRNPGFLSQLPRQDNSL